MPIYDFKCLTCKSEFSAFVSMSEDTTLCPDCGEDKVEKQIGQFNSSIKKSNYVSKTGDLVKSHIEDAKKEIKKEKKLLKSREL